ncbi:hypothetical protein QTV44_002467, partial [Vibrio vulnificus]|nr:hypothetical protein [Vibrio vulnificus]
HAQLPEQSSDRPELNKKSTNDYAEKHEATYTITLRNKVISTSIWQHSLHTPNKFTQDEFETNIRNSVEKIRAIQELERRISELEAIQRIINITEDKAKGVKPSIQKKEALTTKSATQQSMQRKAPKTTNNAPSSTMESKSRNEKVSAQDTLKTNNSTSKEPKHNTRVKKQSATEVAAAISAGAAQTPSEGNEQKYKDAIKAVNIGESKKYKQLDKASKAALKTAIERKIVLNTNETVSQRIAKQPKETHDKLHIISRDISANNSIMAGAIIAFDSPRAHKNPNLSEAAIGDFVFEEMFNTEHDDKYYILRNMISETIPLDKFYEQYKAEIGEAAFSAKFGQEVAEYEKNITQERNIETNQESTRAPEEHKLKEKQNTNQGMYQEYESMSQ